MDGSRYRRRTAPAALVVLLLVCLVAPGPPLEGQDEAAAQRLLQEAERQLASGNPTGAIAEYEALFTRFPNSRMAPRALLRWAEVQHGQGDWRTATDLADRLVQQYPASPQAAAAMVLQARIQLANADDRDAVEQARTLLGRVPNLFGPEGYPSLEARTEARVRGAETGMLLGDLPGAALELLQAIEIENDSPWSARARIGLARVLLYSDSRSAIDLATAVQLLQEAVDAGGAAAAGSVAGDAAAEARDLLTTIHRLLLRPAAGTAPWISTSNLPGIQAGKPQSLAASFDGQVAVIDADAVVLRSGSGVVQRIGGLRNAGRPWFGDGGLLYVPIEGTVREIPGSGSRRFYYEGPKPKDLDKIQAGAHGLFGEWWIYDRSVDGVVVFDRRIRKTLGLAPSSGIDVADLAAGPLGRVYVLSPKSSRVTIFDAGRRAVGGFVGSWNRPDAIAVDQLGNVYVLDRSARQVDVRTAAGARIATLGPVLPGGLELRSPEDIAVDAAGRVLILDTKLATPVVLE
ncbi:MAG TPA: tetratricopeptide repeat protein [Thermoanaerobaculia bacterium]|nr:tetratricopeptide repeat protein [Thermoanaerobaculia bacterium]